MPDIETIGLNAEALGAIIENWFFEAFHGSLVARSTDIWNVVHAAKEDLKRRLSKHAVADGPAVPPVEL